MIMTNKSFQKVLRIPNKTDLNNTATRLCITSLMPEWVLITSILRYAVKLGYLDLLIIVCHHALIFRHYRNAYNKWVSITRLCVV